MAANVVGRAFASNGIVRCCRPQYLPRARHATFRPAVRSFAARARAWEKKYTEDHEWIELSGDGKTGTIGVSEYAAIALGEVVYVELPTLEMEITKGDSIGAVESVKSASDIMTPVSGKIVEANSVLEDTPKKINDSPEGDGWIARIELSNVSELESLMDGAKYKAFTEEEGK